MSRVGATPTGWFQVAWSADLAVGDVKGLHYFGTDLVVYRGLDGHIRGHDRYCRHLGGNLAQGGVVDDGIRCPLHGWVWGTDGRNVSIPYQDRPNTARTVRPWPVHEGNGAVYLWHDALGGAPRWDIPDYFTALGEHISGRIFYPSDPPEHRHFPALRLVPQLVAENAVDLHHLRFLHGTSSSPVVVEEHIEGPSWQAKVAFGPDADRSGTVDTPTLIFWGLGVSVSGELTADGARVISICTTPVDEDRSEIFATYWIERTDRDDPAELQRRLAEAKQVVPDAIGLGTSGSAGFRRLRRWSQQFYPHASVIR